jgi:hypothetical protein
MSSNYSQIVNFFVAVWLFSTILPDYIQDDVCQVFLFCAHSYQNAIFLFLSFSVGGGEAVVLYMKKCNPNPF